MATDSSWIYILVWISLSCLDFTLCSMILFNKAILTNWHFSYPFFLTGSHMLVATIFTQILSRTTNLLTSVSEKPLSFSVIFKRVLPIAFLFALSLMFGNQAYLFLSVSFIQMLKAFTPVLVFIISCSFGLEKLYWSQFVIVFLISFGVATTTIGELQFSWIGFVFQGIAIFCEGLRLVLAEKLLKELKLDPLSTLYYLAPLSFFFILIGFVYFELPHFPFDILLESIPSSSTSSSSSFAFFHSPSILFFILLSGCLAFFLNISFILLVSHTSALILALSGIGKDILLIVFSILFFSTPISFVQGVGYAFSLGGLHLYREYKQDRERTTEWIKEGCVALGCMRFREEEEYYQSIQSQQNTEVSSSFSSSSSSSSSSLVSSIMMMIREGEEEEEREGEGEGKKKGQKEERREKSNKGERIGEVKGQVEEEEENESSSLLTGEGKV